MPSRHFSFIFLTLALFALFVIHDIRNKFKLPEIDSNQMYEERWNLFLSNIQSKGDYCLCGSDFKCNYHFRNEKNKRIY